MFTCITVNFGISCRIQLFCTELYERNCISRVLKKCFISLWVPLCLSVLLFICSLLRVPFLIHLKYFLNHCENVFALMTLCTMQKLHQYFLLLFYYFSMFFKYPFLSLVIIPIWFHCIAFLARSTYTYSDIIISTRIIELQVIYHLYHIFSFSFIVLLFFTIITS